MSTLGRLWNLFRRTRIDDELRREIETHLTLIENAPVNSVTVLLEASRAAAPSDTAPIVLSDEGWQAHLNRM
jgi:hypothetical protein